MGTFVGANCTAEDHVTVGTKTVAGTSLIKPTLAVSLSVGRYIEPTLACAYAGETRLWMGALVVERLLARVSRWF